ncbi:MAG: hypothetical protein ACRDJ3_00005, partial [Solirubrobacteraceae bacterium]
MKSIKLATVVAVTACCTPLAIAGCGNGEVHEARQLSGISILRSAKPLGANLVSETEIHASDDPGVKTLLEFWKALQYQDYESAANFFYPS